MPKARIVTYQGKPYTIRQLAGLTGVPYHTMTTRINTYGMTGDEAVAKGVYRRHAFKVCPCCGQKVKEESK